MTTYENPDVTLAEQSSPARPRRPRLSRAEGGSVLIAAAAVAGFTGYGFATHSPSTVGYVSSVLVIAAAVAGLRRVVLPPLLAAGLAIAAIATLAGGLIRVGHDVLYNASTGPYSPSLGTHFLQYDHVAHAYCSFVIVFACWVLLAAPHAGTGRRGELVLLAVGAALGLSAQRDGRVHRHPGPSRSPRRRLLEHRLGPDLQLHRDHRRRAGHRQVQGWYGMTVLARSTGMTSPEWIRVRLGCAAASAAVFASAVVVIGSLTPGYNQWSDAVSRLASPGERWALAARAAFAVYGLMIVAGASALRPAAGRQGRTLAFLLTLYGTASIVAGVAPKDQPGAPHTVLSQVHVWAAIGAGVLAIGAMTLVSRCGPDRAARRAAAAMALLTGLAAVVFKYAWGTQLYGVSERVLLGLGMCWIFVLAARALTRVS